MKKKKIKGLVFIWIGLSILLFPLVKGEIKNYQNAIKIQEVHQNLDQLDLEAIKKKGRTYNEDLAQGTSPSLDPFEEEAVLEENPLGSWQEDDLVGSIELPKINIEDPLFIGVNDQKLSKGACVIDGTSLPFGGTGTRSVIAGHRGNYDGPSFLDVDKLEPGDEMILHVLDEDLVYQVTTKEIIDPYETEKLMADPDKDQITLLTCHPFPRRTHRLLINGERKLPVEVEEEEEELVAEEIDTKPQVKKEAGSIDPRVRYRELFLRICLFLVLVLWMRTLIKIIGRIKQK